MKETEHTIPKEYLEEVKNSPTRRHARIIAGWIHRSHGQTKENRRTIQNAIAARKISKQTEDNDRGNNQNHI
ncbi:MAG: hypothetical protein US95_C0001G0009 [Candidatus Woesebacteria bacterium GW2011_GWB1_38_5]|uniref:Uncharacterized protein n=4 Tax=Candidatus Woeseibacteriota TaxID=1752722 RepID=A0A0G0L3V1_9BACT|nr:MAG: hypothetical protein US67_C0003G0025 [Candidatus Woesebacteria bacterium GW2011_GWD1_38_10]KKQ56965.1 MAG: hypothetical protein US75_C0001G0022 [Candidatus Woesebacteria bacterium GW2011_GWC1_38_13]KKQ75578.1 MAG: hypothetical protein US95_C0001G0009 [Candidatus Woesebacteria bacterium GW2011_GWB1_38_5]KKQ76237.1 MAG: hypothetical protein US97_C0016G0005 [Microgenomates group bacterium GW2011_GWF1_38_5]KKQ82575.1 MAG: hypothetical protein UT06_C0046G0007 [Candidatus Woesebacteria bacter